MRRLAPRPFGDAVERVARSVAPSTPLARVQAAWASVAGEAVAREAEPVAERDGVVTIACRSAVWAHELELLGADLRDRLNRAISAPGGGPRVDRLRFVTGAGRGGS